jgi:hypothetical protein
MIGAAPAFAAPSGAATSSATPSNAAPSIGQQIVVSINIDMSGVDPPDDKLGSFTGHLDWNPAVVAYNSNSAILAGFVGVVNTSSAGSGHMIFNGAKVSGATGNTVVLTITFGVVGAGTSVLNLEYPSMAAAATFVELLPILTVTDGLVVVNSAAQHVYLPWVGKH